MGTDEQLLCEYVRTEFVAQDLHCADCGYNLRTLSEESRCPECGLAISMTRQVEADEAARRVNGRQQASLLLAISIGLWVVGGLLLIAIVVVFNVAGEVGEDFHILERATNVLAFLFAATGGMMLIISSLLSLSAVLHRDYANAWRFLLSAVINPMSLLLLIVLIVALF